MKVKIAGIIFILVGLVLLVGAGIESMKRVTLLQNGVTGQAKILNIYSTTSTTTTRSGGTTRRRSTTGSYGEIEYTAGGQTYSGTIGITVIGGKPNHQVGETLPIIYAPDDPTDMQINTPGDLWFPPALLTLIGLGVAAVGVFILRVARRSTPLAPTPDLSAVGWRTGRRTE